MKTKKKPVENILTQKTLDAWADEMIIEGMDAYFVIPCVKLTKAQQRKVAKLGVIYRETL